MGQKKLENFFKMGVLVVALFWASASKIEAATYTWQQSGWMGSLDGGTYPSHTINQTNWIKYFSKDIGTTTNADGNLIISPTVGSVSQTSDSDFSVGTTNSVNISDNSVLLSMGEATAQVSEGGNHTCVLKTNGSVWCWGLNDSGQLGIGNTESPKTTPQQVLGVNGSGYLTGVSAISAGKYNTCALKTNGTMYCWGSNIRGQLGLNNYTNQSTPQQVLGVNGSGYLTGVSAISAGTYHTCALKTNGTMYCWGYNELGRLGINSQTAKITPQQVVGVGGSEFLSDVSAISAKDLHTCALKTDGTVYCWGNNASGQLGTGNNQSPQITPQQTVGVGGSEFLSDVSAISLGLYHTCAVKTDNTVYCWGSGQNGQVGINNWDAITSTPQQVLGVDGSGFLTGITSVETGDSHTCSLKNNGTVYCWGWNAAGQLGLNTDTQYKLTAQQVLGPEGSGNLTDIIGISLGYDSSCALKSDGSVYCWGLNSSGQLGLNNIETPKRSPQQVLGSGGSGNLDIIVYLSSGNFTSSAIDLGQNSDLTYLSFGANQPDNTELKFQIRSAATANGLSSATWYGPTGTDDYYTGVGTTLNPSNDGDKFIQYKAFFETSDISYSPTLNDITVNYEHYSADAVNITQTSDADFSVGTTSSTNVSGNSVLLSLIGPTAQIVNGQSHTCALKTDGTVYCWGNNVYGQLGLNNTTSPKTTPEQVVGVGGSGFLTGVSSITAGLNFTCASKTDGTAYCWGYNAYGQLGLNNFDTPKTTPQQVVGVGGSGFLTGVSSIASGNNHGCVVKTDGTVYCWGYNVYGQLGLNNDDTFKATPQQVVGVGGSGFLSGISNITAGEYHSCALKTNGTMYCWGRNDEGQLGLNNTTQQNIPQQVLGVGGSGFLTEVSNIDSDFNTCAVKIDGTVYCWGYNNNGQLGLNNTTTPYTTAQQVLGVGGTVGNLTDVVSIAVSQDHSCAIKTDGTVYCWGYNNNGQLGLNNVDSPKTTPQQVLGVNGTGLLDIIATIYASSGNFISGVIDIGNTNLNLTTLSWGATTPTNTLVKFQMRSADTEGGLGGATWYGPTGTEDYYTNSSTAINSNNDGDRYVQYKAFLETSDTNITPTLGDVTLGYVPLTKSVSLISSPYNTTEGTNLLSQIRWTEIQPESTEVKYQVRTAPNSDGSPGSWNDWTGPTGTSSYFTLNTGQTSPSGLRDGVNDQWIQYKAFLETSDSGVSPTISDVTLTYVVNAPPEFDPTYETNGFEVTAGVVGSFNFLYKVGDIDTDEGSPANQYKLWPTFEYTIDNGGTWTTIISENLTGPNQNNEIELTDTSIGYTGVTIWNATADLPTSYETVKIRMTLDDHEAANNMATVTSDAFVVDTKIPEVGTPDGGGVGININGNVTTALATDKTNNRNVTLNFSASDDSDLQVKYSTSSLFTGAEYEPYVESIGFTLPSGDGSKRVYIKFKDYYGNESDVSSDVIELDTISPTKPLSLLIQDVSNTSAGESRLFVNWAKNSDIDWYGYKVYRSTDGQVFSHQQTINNINTNYILDTGVSGGADYFYKVTAIDDLLNESIGSTVSQTVGGNPSDAVPPTISNVLTSNKTSSSITITWTTNEISNSTILFSTDTSYDNTQGSAGYATSHSVTLAGLSGGTTYNFKVRSSDPSGNTAETEADVFITNTADTTGPVVSSINISNITDASAIVSFSTNEASSSFVEFNVNSGFTGGNLIGYNGLSLSHSIKLNSLIPDTTYYYKIKSTDAAGNESISSEKTFTTLASDSDITPPTISAVTASNINYNTATISFTTNENASSFIEFGKTSGYGRIYGSDESVTSHTVTLPYDLKPETVYFYRVRSKDMSENEAVGLGDSFTTATDPNDLVAPVISSVNIGEPGKNAVTITWTTNEVANSYLGFSEDLSYVQEQGKPTMVLSHSVTLVGLKPRTHYFFRIKSSDPSGNLTIDNNSSQGYTFVTADGENPPIISANQIKNVGTSSAQIYWETDINSNSYVEYGFDESYGNWAGLNDSVTEHSVDLKNLLSAATYNFRVRSKSTSGSEGVSQNYTLTTQGIATTEVGSTTPATSTSPSETTILDSIKNGTVDFVKKVLNIIPETKISEGDFVDTLNSMSPKIVSSPTISASNISVDPGVDKIIISWKTDKKSSSIVAYAMEKEYDSTKTDPYVMTVGNPDEKVTDHSVEIINLNPNTTYHYQVRSKADLGNWAKSEDYSFTTLAINSEIRDLKFIEIGEKSVNASWQTNYESRGMVEVLDAITEKPVLKEEEIGFSKSHSFKTNKLQLSTNYKLKIINVAKDGTMSEGSFYPFSTSTSSNPPEISNVRISNALIPGAVEQVQTIISWKTDKPSTSKIIYDEGLLKDLKMSTALDKSLVFDHIVVMTALKTGKVYKFKTESMDSNSSVSQSKDFIIMTPKPQESVVNLIIDNFTQSFSFIRGNKK